MQFEFCLFVSVVGFVIFKKKSCSLSFCFAYMSACKMNVKRLIEPVERRVSHAQGNVEHNLIGHDIQIKTLRL